MFTVICPCFLSPPPQSIFHRIHLFAHFLLQYLSPNNKQVEPLKRFCLQWYWGSKDELQGIEQEPRASNKDGAVPNLRPVDARSKE